jgi:hypothetical protein
MSLPVILQLLHVEGIMSLPVILVELTAQSLTRISCLPVPPSERYEKNSSLNIT